LNCDLIVNISKYLVGSSFHAFENLQNINHWIWNAIFFIQIDQKQKHIKFCTMFRVLKFRSENEEVKVLGSEIEFSWRLSALFKGRQNSTTRYWWQILRNSIFCYKKAHMAWARLKNDRQETAKAMVRVDNTRKCDRARPGTAAGEIKLWCCDRVRTRIRADAGLGKWRRHWPQ